MQMLHLQDKSRTRKRARVDMSVFSKGFGPMYRLTEAFPYLLNRVGVRMGELFSRRLESYGVTLHMYRVMAGAVAARRPASWRSERNDERGNFDALTPGRGNAAKRLAL